MIEEIQTVETGISRLLNAGKQTAIPFKVKRGDHTVFDILECASVATPVLKWRYNPKWHTMREDILFNPQSQLGTPSMLKVMDVAPESETMIRILCREIDLAEFFLDSQVKSVIGFGSEKAANFIFKMGNDVIFSLEAAVTLPPEAARETKHTLYSTNGMITDLAADKIIPSDQIYVFNEGKDPVTYTDHDITLFGLSLEDQDLCYACYDLITGREDPIKWKRQSEHLEQVSAAAMETLGTGRKYSFAVESAE